MGRNAKKKQKCAHELPFSHDDKTAHGTWRKAYGVRQRCRVLLCLARAARLVSLLVGLAMVGAYSAVFGLSIARGFLSCRGVCVLCVFAGGDVFCFSATASTKYIATKLPSVLSCAVGGCLSGKTLLPRTQERTSVVYILLPFHGNSREQR